MAIVGAGMGGVAAAYFLAAGFDVDLFEARSRIGGHCDSRVIKHRGQSVVVDLGAQFFHPDTHPIYVTLLEDLGLYDPEHPEGDATVQAPASLCIFPTAGGAPVFSSLNPLSTPERAVDFATFTQLARQAVLTDMSWETTVDAWIRGLPLKPAFKGDVLYPWITATIGCTRGDARRASARSILQTFALAFPAELSQSATTYNSKIGLQGNLQRMLDRSPSVRVHLSRPAQALSRKSGGWFVRTPRGRKGPYRFVVLNAPPRAGRELLRPLPAFADATELLDEYRYFDSRLLIHTDPAYVHRDRSNWAAYNAGVDGLECEGSSRLGALQETPAGGTGVDVFKSWAQRRRADPKHVLLERRFKHPIIGRSTIKAARALHPLQGQHGLYFSGQYTTGMDLQETALYSAMQVAGAIAPDSPTLASLKTRLSARGRAGIAYDL
ncbi:FAD-dependent oxidoreductase [Solirubrobacter soli]|uniref:FAD-dependent oxidoreductase n=1 Tax=Solirubrobacter soli TaxID=363832 RepID=UPI0003F619E8|nr:FAD-dependent oxidoreductase [Solirubrobacter soli]